MGKVVTQASMSLDGFIADPSGGVGPLFDWYGNGDVEFTGADPDRVFRVSAASAEYLSQAWANAGVGVIGRRLFDMTNGWNGRPPVGDAVVVVTHRPPTDWDFRTPRSASSPTACPAPWPRPSPWPGTRTSRSTPATSAARRSRPGSSTRCSSTWSRSCSAPASATSATTPARALLLENPEVVQGDRVTHLRYRVRRA